MSDPITKSLKQDAKESPKTPDEVLENIRVGMAQIGLKERELRHEIAKKDVRSMRRWIVVVGAIVPFVMLVLLLGHVYWYWPMFDVTKASTDTSFSVPMTALIIGTFASFIVVYSTMLVGVFRSASDSSREKQSESDIYSIVSKAVQSAMKGGSGNGA